MHWDPTLLWLTHKPVGAAPIRPLAWESPHARGVALEKTKKKKKKMDTVNICVGYFITGNFLGYTLQCHLLETIFKRTYIDTLLYMIIFVRTYILLIKVRKC